MDITTSRPAAPPGRPHRRGRRGRGAFHTPTAAPVTGLERHRLERATRAANATDRAIREISSGLAFLESLPTKDLAIVRLRRDFETARRTSGVTASEWRQLASHVEDVVAYGPDRRYMPPSPIRTRSPQPPPRGIPTPATAAALTA